MADSTLILKSITEQREIVKLWRVNFDFRIFKRGRVSDFRLFKGKVSHFLCRNLLTKSLLGGKMQTSFSRMKEV